MKINEQAYIQPNEKLNTAPTEQTFLYRVKTCSYVVL